MTRAAPSSSTAPPRPRIPPGVWALGAVSLLMDASTEMIQSLLPLFLVSGLGASALSVGLIEGIGEATAAITKVFSGAVSDWARRRKPLLLLGYGLAALSKPAFAVAPAVGWVLAARFVDRLGKGIRGAPRDALVADLTPSAAWGAAFGLRQSLDTIGAVAGPLMAMLVMTLFAGAYRLAFWIAVIPALLSVLTVLLAVREPASAGSAGRNSRPPPSWTEVRRLPRHFWGVTAVAMVMTLARFSEGFLLLRAQSVGLAPALVPLVLAAMNLVYAATAYPIGRLSDRLGRRGLLFGGFVVLLAADLVLAAAGGIAWMFVGVGLWGLHMGMTQGLLASLVADTAPPAWRGTAFGVFNLGSGVALLLASLIAGALWTTIGPAATFAAGAAFTALALAGLCTVR